LPQLVPYTESDTRTPPRRLMTPVKLAGQHPPLSAGNIAPDFELASVGRKGTVALSDYRGRTPVLLAMMRGLYCAFCRRHIAQLGSTRQKLMSFGVETLAIIAMPAERLRLYYRYRPVGVPLAADPELSTHRAYGLPRLELSPEIKEVVAQRHIELAHQLEIRTRDVVEIKTLLCGLDGFNPNEAEQQNRRDWSEKHGAQMIGQFLVDREGIIRWANIEGANNDGLAGLEKFPTDEEFVEVVRLLR
jgi:peroxiredoxin